MKTAMVLLVGEQPVPNLLPTRHLKPNAAVLVHTDRTAQVAENLKALLESSIPCLPCLVSPYKMPEILQKLQEFLSKNLAGYSLLFNLTGGTKPMALAAYNVAQRYRSPVLYFQTEGSQSLLYRYEFSEAGQIRLVEKTSLPGTITIADYLQSYVGQYEKTGFSKSAGGNFEQAVYQVLLSVVDEIIAGVKLGGALDVDLVLRCRNQVGIAEVKTGKKARTKEGIDQLNTAGGRAFLGIYTRKFLIVDAVWDVTLSNLRELAEARNIQVVQLPSYAQMGTLSGEDRQVLIETVQSVLRCHGGDR